MNGRIERLLWLWVIAIFVAYMAQFRGLVAPILGLLGLR